MRSRAIASAGPATARSQVWVIFAASIEAENGLAGCSQPHVQQHRCAVPIDMLAFDGWGSAGLTGVVAKINSERDMTVTEQIQSLLDAAKAGFDVAAAMQE